MEHLVSHPDGVYAVLHVDRARIAQGDRVVALEARDGVKGMPAVARGDVEQVYRALLVD